MKDTPLRDVHIRLGAKMVEFGGWYMPVQYGPILEEVTTVRTKAGLFDLSHMGRVNVKGPDTLRYLERICTNHVAKIPLGAIRYSLFCRADGNPIDDLLVYRGSDEVYLVVNASNTAVDLGWMREHAQGFNVTIEDLTDAQAMIALQGQVSTQVMQPLCEGIELSKLGYYKFGFGTFCGLRNTRISRTGYTGEQGFEVYVAAKEGVRCWNLLMEAGAAQGVKPIGLGARDTLRLEAGMPLYGHEIDATHNPIEAGLSFGVSFAPEKGDWIGRTPLEALAKAPKRQLVGLKTDGPRVPRQGYKLFQGTQEIGYVVSGSVSPTLSTNIGTCYVPVGGGQPGASCELDVKGKRQPASFCALPFFSRTRK